MTDTPLLLPPPPDDQGASPAPPDKVYPPPPPGVTVLSNGAGRDALGRFAFPPGTFGPGASPIASSAIASALGRRRAEIHRRKRQQAIIDAVAEALDQDGDTAARLGFSKAVSQADADTFRVLWRDVVLGPRSRLRDRVMAYVRLGQVADLPGMRDDREAGEGVQVTVSVSGRALDRLFGLVGDRLGR